MHKSGCFVHNGASAISPCGPLAFGGWRYTAEGDARQIMTQTKHPRTREEEEDEDEEDEEEESVGSRSVCHGQ